MYSVLIIQEHLPAFRVPFYQQLRDRLAACGVDLRLIYAPNQKNTFLKGELDWATAVPIRWLGPIAWQSVLSHARRADLVILQQESKYMVNPLLQALAKAGWPPVAYWGHGRNFQAPVGTGYSAKFKKFLATKVDWWFAYNDLSAQIVRDVGYPANCITSVGNAIDTTGLIEGRNSLTAEKLADLRKDLNINSENVAVYTGGLYTNKRIAFLIESAIHIRKQIPDFELIIIGDGPDRQLVSEAARRNSWIHDIGPKNDYEKVPYWVLCKVLLMPGLVGLVVVDSFALGVPLITSDYPFHSPEIDYLKNDVNGLVVNCGESSEIYADAVSALLKDPVRLNRLKEQALASANQYTIENMVLNFSTGVLAALKKKI